MGLFRRKPRPESTGHALDDELLAQIAQRSDLTTPRHWVHYLYVADEPAAQAAAASARSAGWDVHVDTAADGAGWLVLAEQHDAVTSPAAVRAARELFEGLAAAAPGGDYDGWEASL